MGEVFQRKNRSDLDHYVKKRERKSWEENVSNASKLFKIKKY